MSQEQISSLQVPEIAPVPPWVIEEVSELYSGLAQRYLTEDSVLRGQIMEYYADHDRLTQELSTVFQGCSEEEITNQIREVEQMFQDKTRFIEHYQKLFERTSAIQRRKHRGDVSRMATDEEYEAGTYREGLEIQMQDAVFTLFGKGYRSFESGFSEKQDSRDQYIGFYTRHLTLPEGFVEDFKKRGFEITVVTDTDRTVLNIHPLSTEAILLEEWKEVWDEVADRLPDASLEQVDGAKTYTMQQEFRKSQDALKAQE